MRILALLLSALTIFGDQITAPPFELVYDYDYLTAVRLYADGQLLKEYQTNEVVLIGPAQSNNFANTYAITVPAMMRRTEPVSFTAAVFIRNGSLELEGDANEPVQVSLRPPATSALRVYRPIDDDAAIERVAATVTVKAMKVHPLWRSMFQQAAAQIDTLSHADKIDVGAVLAIVKRYPQTELDGQTRLLLTQFERGDGVNTRAVVISLLRGMQTGLNTQVEIK